MPTGGRGRQGGGRGGTGTTHRPCGGCMKGVWTLPRGTRRSWTKTTISVRDPRLDAVDAAGPTDAATRHLGFTLRPGTEGWSEPAGGEAASPPELPENLHKAHPLRSFPQMRMYRLHGGSSQEARAARSTECSFCVSRRSSSSGKFRQMSAWYGFVSSGLAVTERPFAAASSTLRTAHP